MEVNMKLLITGGKGQLGRQIKSIIERNSSDIGKLDQIFKDVECKFIDYDELDITNFTEVISFIGFYKPDVIINCAAYTNVDGCENDKDAAFKVNAIGPRNLAIASEKFGIKLLHVSTDYVFNGEGTVPFKEYDIPQPVSVYGKTKLLGEQYVRENCSHYYIVRTAWLYGEWGKNFVYTIMKSAKENGHLFIVSDQRGNPTYAEDLAYHILKIILTNEYGIYHCTGTGECSWYDFALKIIEYSRIEATVFPCTTDEYLSPAKRPAYSALDNMMLRCTIGDGMRDWENALKCFIESYNWK
jgi:dTDP-4-dehydrorhamnose reductase